MHNSSVMPFIHLALVAIAVLAFVALVVVKKFGKRKAHGRAPESSEEAETKHG
jgi:hypothetical protein